MSTPGRTRSVNYFLVNRRFWFVDLPGYGYAKAGKQERREWAALADTYFKGSGDRGARPLVVMLVDGKVGATPLDAQAWEYLRGLGSPVLVVATKVDRIPRGRRGAMEKGVGEALELDGTVPLIPVSAHSGEGMKELWGALAPHLEASAT